MLDALIAGALAGYAIAIPLGPIAILILDTGLRRGARVAAAAGAGAATADGLYATVAGLVGAAVTGAVAPWIGALRVVGAAVLLVIAARIAVGARGAAAAVPARSGSASSGATYVAFLGLTVINPMTFVYFATLILSLPLLAPGAGPRLAFAAGAFAASLSWQLGLAVVGGIARGRLSPRVEGATRLVGAALITFFALRIALDLA